MITLKYVAATFVCVSLLGGTPLWAQPAFPAKAMEAVNALYAGTNPQDDEARKVAIKKTCEQLAADLGPRWGGKKRTGLPDDYRSPDSLAFHEEDGSVSVWDIQASSGAILVHAGKTPDYPRLPAAEATFMSCEPRNWMGGNLPSPGAPPVPGPSPVPPPVPPPPPIDLSQVATKEDVARLEQKIDAVKQDTEAVRSGMNKAWKIIGKYGPIIFGGLAAGWFAKPDETQP